MERITFTTDDGLTLEADLWLPDAAAVGSAVVCHAHPRFGGSKDYPLLWGIRIELVRAGFAVLAFNFRGVMGSEGDFAGGVDEVLDVRAAVGRARIAAEGPTVVCGWSFGAHVALRACLDDQRVAGLALVGMPLTGADPTLPPLPASERLRSYARPVLLLAGGDDPYCPAPGLKELAETLPDARIRIVPGADHYFRRQEREAGGTVAAFAAEVAEAGKD